MAPARNRFRPQGRRRPQNGPQTSGSTGDPGPMAPGRARCSSPEAAPRLLPRREPVPLGLSGQAAYRLSSIRAGRTTTTWFCTSPTSMSPMAEWRGPGAAKATTFAWSASLKRTTRLPRADFPRAPPPRAVTRLLRRGPRGKEG